MTNPTDREEGAAALKISDMRDILTAEEQRKLDADLREIARRRRKAFDDSANISMP